jgi:multidrug efflux pump subunit AcrA (membrane-fusion protein)
MAIRNAIALNLMTINEKHLVSILIAVAILCGCDPAEKVYPEIAPVPVTVMRLSQTTPRTERRLAGSVRSWKTEDIAFEASGRVKWVVEPGTEVKGRTFSADGKVQSPGTQIAQLDEQRYKTAVESAESQVEIAILKCESIKIQIESGLPAERSAAQSELDLARTEYERNQRLVAQNAGSRKNLDKALAALNAAKSQLDGLQAKLKTLEADQKSSKAAIAQAKQSLRDAKRDLQDTRLFSAFNGVISDVYVVPGSVAGPQVDVVAIQMMNPIKVEVEISADMSRKIRRNDTVPLSVDNGAGQKQAIEAIVYNMAPSADNATRTFKLTLLVGNRKLQTEISGLEDARSIPRTDRLWRVNLGILPETGDGTWYMPESGLHQDSRGDFAWKITNMNVGGPVQRLLTVEKLYVNAHGESVPFLGKMRFRTVEVLPDQGFDPDIDLFLNEIRFDDEVENQPDDNGDDRGNVDAWEGGKAILDDGGRWLLRPGDVVDLELETQKTQSGIFVPIEAIYEDSGNTSVFVVESSSGASVARMVPVNVIVDDGEAAASTQRIQSVSGDSLDGAIVVTKGVHYLSDGQKVNVTNTADNKAGAESEGGR